MNPTKPHSIVPVQSSLTILAHSSALRIWLHSCARGVAILILGLLFGEGVIHAAAPKVYITEVMVSNRRTVMDEDRQVSDWIEIFNAGGEAVDLKGWSLTDSAKQLTKWTFPETHLNAGEYLLVFASGKNRSQAGHELHTNFKLSHEGEYLALVQPDGKTIAMHFKPALPKMRPDVSYGIPLKEDVTLLIPREAPKWVRVPTPDLEKELQDTWKTAAIAGSGWLLGKGGIGFDRGTNVLPWVGSDVSSLMSGKASGMWIRVPFVVTNLEMDRLALRMFYDDGFVAWLNGKEVARRNAPQTVGWNAAALKAREMAAPVVSKEDFEGEQTFSFMNGDPNGRCRISISTPDTNHYARIVNGRLNDQVNGVAFPQVIQGSARSSQLSLDFRVKGGGPPPNDLYFSLIPVSTYGAKGNGAPLNGFLNGREVDAKDCLTVHLELSSNGREAVVGVNWNGERKAEHVIRDPSLAWRFYHRASLKLDFKSDGVVCNFRVLTDVRGGSGHDVVLLKDEWIPGPRSYAARWQITGRSRSNLVTMDLDNLDSQWLPQSDNLNEDFDLAAFRSALRLGTNILAVHGLNAGPTDPDFLILPELYAFNTRLRLDAPQYFSPATPLAANSEAGFASIAPTPSVTPKSKLLESQTPIQISCSLTGAVIRYTLDGSEPTASSQVYSGPFELDRPAILKATAFAAGYLPSTSALETYTVADGDIANFSSNLPILVLNTEGRANYENRKIPVVARIVDPGTGGRATLNSDRYLETRGDMNLRGFSSTRYPKRSYTFRIRDEYGEKVKTPLLGLPKESDWVLYAPYPDKTLMRDVLAYDLSRAMGHYAPRTRFVEVFINPVGDRLSWKDYQGVYVLVEKIKRGKNRVNIEEMSPGDTSEPEISGGYIVKRDHSNKDAPTFSLRGGEFFVIEPQPEDITPIQRQWIERHFRELERSIYGKQFLDPKKGYRNYLDVPSFIDQHWLIEMSKNIDGYRYSVYFSKDRGGKVKLEPVWDWNLSFGNANYLDGENTRGWYTEQLRDSEISWFRKLVEDPEFDLEQADRWWELRRGPFKTESILKRVDEMAGQLQEAQARNFRRWQILGRFVHPNAYVGNSYAEEVNWMKEWITERIQWIDSQMPSAPTVTIKSDKGESKATLKGRGGKLYYTTDGTDPRLPGGALNPAAKVYEGPIPVSGVKKLVVRVQLSDRWSPAGVWSGSF